VGTIEHQWRHSVTRRQALAGLAGCLAGSPLLRAQQDPRPLKHHVRALGFNEMVTAFDFEPVCFANVPLATYDYTAHGDGSEFTLRRNREAFDWVEPIPRPAVDVRSVNTATTVLGLEMDFPILVAPTATQGPLHPDGELGMHRGATAAKTPMIVSNITSVPIDKIAAAAIGPLWFQFYPRQDLDDSRDMLEKAQAAGCRAVVVTVDQQAASYERSLQDRNLGGTPRTSARRPGTPRNPYRMPDGRLWYTWPYLDDIRKFITVPMLIKGIVTAEDAALCVDRGMNGIIVSNHGGRSLDYGPSTLEVLPEIVEAVRGRVPILVDSGFRRGADILKAIALGANAVCLGRTTRWALGAYGAPGVQRVLEIFQAELVAAMAKAGRPTLASVDRSAVRTRFS
jgi:4-hydroxymandelate oxidase